MSTELTTPSVPTISAQAARSPEKKRKTAAARLQVAPAPPAFDAPFGVIDTQPADAPAWPTHPVCWFQRNLAPSLPGWSGLTIERRYRVPVADFVYQDPIPSNRPAALDGPQPLVRHNGVTVPTSGLALAGREVRKPPGKESFK
jgi:hypothetical protein